MDDLLLEEIDVLKHKAKETNKNLFFGWHTIPNPEVKMCKEYLKGKEVLEIKVEFNENVYSYHNPKDWIFNKKVSGGGVLMDSGINVISIINYILEDFSYLNLKSELVYENNLSVETKAKVSFRGKYRGEISIDWLHKGKEKRQITFFTKDSEIAIDLS